MKISLIFLITASSVQVCWGNEKIESEWVAISRSGEAIYGTVYIDNEFIKWGIPTTNGAVDRKKQPPCKSEYSYEFEKELNLHSIKLKNKECDYAKMVNSHISKALGEWKVEIVKEQDRRLEAIFNDFDEEGKEMGKDIFYKHFQK